MSMCVLVAVCVCVRETERERVCVLVKGCVCVCVCGGYVSPRSTVQAQMRKSREEGTVPSKRASQQMRL